MPDISEYYEGGSGKYLKAADIGDDRTVTVTAWELVEFKDGSKKAALSFAEFPDQLWTVNKTNFDNLKEMYGGDPKKWVGKELRLYSERYKARDGSTGWTVKVKTSMAAVKAKTQQYDERNPPPSDDIPF